MKIIKYDGPPLEFDLKKVKGNPYAILGVSKDATPNMIKKAYHLLAAKYHQDVFHGDTNIFILIGRAKDCLLDSIKRALYDEFYIFGNATGQTTNRAAIGHIQRMFNAIIEQAPQLEFMDIKESMKHGTLKNIDQFENRIRSAKQKTAKLGKMKKRISGTAREGKKLVHLLKTGLDISIEQERQEIAKLKSEQLVLKEMLPLLDEFECTFERQNSTSLNDLMETTAAVTW